MAIKVKTSISEKKTFAQREKFEVTGDYLCEVVGARFVPTDSKYDLRYFIDLKVVDGPALIGKNASWAKFLKETYKTWKNPETGASLTAKELEEMDAESIQIAFAACCGLEREEAVQLAEAGGAFDDVHSFLTSADSDPTPPESIVGRKVIAHVYINKKGYTNTDLLPFGTKTASAPKTETKAPAKVEAKKAAPATPAKAKPTFEAAYKLAGFAHRDDAPGWYWNEGTSEQLDEEDLRSRLGY